MAASHYWVSEVALSELSGAASQKPVLRLVKVENVFVSSGSEDAPVFSATVRWAVRQRVDSHSGCYPIAYGAASAKVITGPSRDLLVHGPAHVGPVQLEREEKDDSRQKIESTVRMCLNPFVFAMIEDQDNVEEDLMLPQSDLETQLRRLCDGKDRVSDANFLWDGKYPEFTRQDIETRATKTVGSAANNDLQVDHMSIVVTLVSTRENDTISSVARHFHVDAQDVVDLSCYFLHDPQQPGQFLDCKRKLRKNTILVLKFEESA